MPRAPRRVLVIDDERDVLVSLEGLLGKLPDCQVELAADYAQGLAKCAEGAWDMVITDERLPGGRGVDILAHARAAQPGAVRVLMSAFQDFDAMMRGVNAAHIDHFIQKPFEPAQVASWVEGRLRAPGAGAAAPFPVRAGPFRRLGGAPRP